MPILTLALASLLAAEPSLPGMRHFKIQIVDEQTGRGVPLVELRTVNNLLYVTDSHGIVAFHEPGLMNQRVFFHIKSHGYEFQKDGFGYRGRALEVTEGGSVQLQIKRLNIAERLYRVTGAGIYRDSVLTGERVPLRRPVLNGLVFGQDSVVNTIYRDKIYWFWGDTNQAAYPLGTFDVPGATSELPGKGGLDPAAGVDLDYFVDAKGFAKATCKMPGSGPTWINSLVNLRDAAGRERLFAAYVKVRGQLDIYAKGLAEFNADKQQFEHVADFDMKAPLHPHGHPFLRTQGDPFELFRGEKGTEYVYFANPFPFVRVRATPEDLKDLSRYEAFTCLKEGSRLDKIELDRTAKGALRYDWKKNTPVLGPKEQAKLVQDGTLKAGEVLTQLQDVETGKPVRSGGGSVYWNEYRKRWVMITTQSFGSSMLGEIWYAEADTPLGPWVYARKIVTHDKYSFYNPKQHPMFDQENGRVIYFEGTYTHTFSGNPEQTARYDYNQIMYRLDLADPRLALPVPVYSRPGDSFKTAHNLSLYPEPIAFFALEQAREGTVPIYPGRDEGGHLRLIVGSPPDGEKSTPLFYVLPRDAKERPATAVPLCEFIRRRGGRAYGTEESSASDFAFDFYKRVEQPLCYVWRNPTSVKLPWP